MSTMPLSGPQQNTQVGQTGMPGNTGPTMPMNYNFMPKARDTGTGLPTGTSTVNTQVGSNIPGNYAANNYITNNPANPFSQYTGFNLGLNSADELTKMYGPLGTALYYYMNNGAGYNPAVLTSLINQIQPQVQQGLATLGATAGETGNRFGSAYQLGTSNFLSQVNQNELGMASNLYEQSQNKINADLMGLLQGAGEFTSNKGGFTSSLISSLLPSLLNPNSTLGGLLTSGLNQIPGVSIPQGGGYPGGGTGGAGGGGWGGISWPGSSTGSGSSYPGGSTTGGTPPTFPNSPQLIWDQQQQTQSSAGNATAGGTLNAKTGQIGTSGDQLGYNNMNYLIKLLMQSNPNFGGPQVPLQGGGGDASGGADIPYLA